MAGESAGLEARRQRGLADAHRRQADDAERRAERFEIAERTESETARILAPLAGIGYHLLADRRWPGSPTAQVDMVVVGRGGVFIVDTKAWREVAVHGDRITRGQEDVTDDIARLADLAYSTEAALADTGLAPNEVHAIAALAGQRRMHARVASVDVLGVHDVIGHITKRGARLSVSRVDEVLAALLRHFPVIGEQPDTPPQVIVPSPVLSRSVPPAIPGDDRADDDDHADEAHDDELAEKLLDGVLEAPIEEWMAFLDPAQAKLVGCSFNGPARIRGAAGTARPSSACTAPPTSRAPPAAASCSRRTSRPSPPSSNRSSRASRPTWSVASTSWASMRSPSACWTSAGSRTAFPDGRRDAFDDAWNAIRASSPLRSARFTRRDLEDEVKHVIKGRGLTRFEEYADLSRVGRKHALPLETRQAVWDLYEAYATDLRKRGGTDWEDVVLMARDALRERPLDRYGAVIVDEAQDLSCAMVSMLHTLVGDRQDGLTLIGDGQQTIYPGGYTLGELGISLAGRGVVLDVNHRNTAEVLEFAKQMVADDQFVDIEGVDGVGDAVSAVTRSGSVPTVHRATSSGDHDAAMIARIRQVLHLVGTGRGDVGVLTATNQQADEVTAALRVASIPVVSLQRDDGKTVDAVKVGTIKRAKGLEFKQVLLAHVRGRLLAEQTGQPSEADRERRELDRRELYVGMTRARDGLWVGVLR
ncbi:AAA family ATPase [Curtobacterium sp. C1]|uniref:3'-5' exonuclease n=1 Tax=Curtobacterium sp. C1 TaxID=2898151 RepID=UPI001E42A1D9|nr:3'-5' exonuclease [Curtobacterium sp. C1]UFU15256.1 AAA family ATPase [Curtobacterium sp. C1]